MKINPSEQRILTAARDLFFKHGFERVSTDSLAREAAVSKATIYRYFTNMTDVLERVTEAEISKFRGGTPPQITSRAELEIALKEYGTRLLTFLNAADTIEFTRLMHEEARSNPEIGRTFYKAAHERTQADLANMIRAGQIHGFVQTEPDPMDVAEDLMGLLEGLGMIRAQMGMSKIPFEDIGPRITRAVATILKMYT